MSMQELFRFTCDACQQIADAPKTPSGWLQEEVWKKASGVRYLVRLNHFCPDCRKGDSK